MKLKSHFGLISNPATKTMIFVDVIGWIGTFLVLLAYFLVTTKKISPSSTEYQLLNLFGAAGIMGNSAVNHALPSVAINIVWIFIALYGLAKSVKK